jgi:hypothetical protein
MVCYMAIVPNSTNFYIIFALTLVVIAAKSILVVFTGKKLMINRKSDEKVASDFLFAVFILFSSMLISRIFFAIFDFYLTKFDVSNYWMVPNVTFWKLGIMIVSLGETYVVYIIDKKILNFKIKGIIELVMIVGIILVVAYPVNSPADFDIVSILTFIPNAGMILFPIVFIWLGRRSSGEVRNTSFALAWGAALYLIGSIFVNAGILNFLNSTFSASFDVFLYFIQTITKILGIVLIAYSASKFRF